MMTDECPEYGVKDTSPLKWLRDEAEACGDDDGRLAFWLREAADQLEAYENLLREARRLIVARGESTDWPLQVQQHRFLATCNELGIYATADKSTGVAD
jgi:hypothetical protein